MPRCRLICWIFGMLILCSCAKEPVKNKSSQQVKPQKTAQKPLPVIETEKTYGLGDIQASQHLLKAETYIQSGDSQSAQREVDLIDSNSLPPEQRSKYNLLEAQIALSSGDAEHALLMLETARAKLLSRADQINYYQSLAFANSLLGNGLAAVNARIHLGSLLQSQQQQQENITTILDMLSKIPLESLNTPSSVTDELSGWMSLARILQLRDQAGFDLAGQIQQWRQKYPKHPANAEFLQAYLAKPAVAAEQLAEEQTPEAAVPANRAASIIAVLLPGSGTYAAAGKAIKDGLIAASKQVGGPSALPLKFYNSEQADIVAQYQQAIADGAKYVIGPLIKEQVQTLAENVELSVPVLALNHIEGLSRTNLYQFGLSPIDEAEMLAAKAHGDGRQTAMVLTPSSSQGQRVSNYLISAWQGQGGVVSGVQSYDPKRHDIAAMLNGLIGPPVEAGAAKKSLTVFLSATPEQARELAPQLKYHQNSDLAIYAMPNIYSGQINPVQDAELGKINFCDIPWLFADTYKGPLSQSAQPAMWQNLGESLIRLPALGIDAYNLITRLNQLADTPYRGATGLLSLNGENRITRKLVCAQFKGGIPVASGNLE